SSRKRIFRRTHACVDGWTSSVEYGGRSPVPRASCGGLMSMTGAKLHDDLSILNIGFL
ncbi:unnamed protein product, partial [Scytosiphon promiscuus]